MYFLEYPEGGYGAPGDLTLTDNTARNNGHHPDGRTDPDGNPVVGAYYLYALDGGVTAHGNRSTNDGGWACTRSPTAPTPC